MIYTLVMALGVLMMKPTGTRYQYSGADFKSVETILNIAYPVEHD